MTPGALPKWGEATRVTQAGGQASDAVTIYLGVQPPPCDLALSLKCMSGAENILLHATDVKD